MVSMFSGRGCRGRDPQHHALCGAGRAKRTGPSQSRDRWSPLLSSGCANLPAALYKAMGGFATNGVNMTKLEKLHDRRQFLRPRNSTPTSMAIPRTRTWRVCAGGTKIPSRANSALSGVLPPGHPVSRATVQRDAGLAPTDCAPCAHNRHGRARPGHPRPRSSSALQKTWMPRHRRQVYRRLRQSRLLWPGMTWRWVAPYAAAFFPNPERIRQQTIRLLCGAS